MENYKILFFWNRRECRGGKTCRYFFRGVNWTRRGTRLGFNFSGNKTSRKVAENKKISRKGAENKIWLSGNKTSQRRK